ncbi:MAG: hypothetical protein HOP02_14660 [Methylococcaceae bacterium]|nr:hypothetical protein [Methylococcaceae bacterium]
MPIKFLKLTVLICLFTALLQHNALAALNAYDKAVLHPSIPFLDETGEHVLKSNKPYSPKKTCEGSGCHDYEKISHAYHFEMGRDETNDKYGEQHGVKPLVGPGFFGGLNCMWDGFLANKMNNPADPDYFAADYGAAGQNVKYCSGCHAGGGWGEKDRDGVRYDQKLEKDIKPGDGDYFTRGYDENNQPIEDMTKVSRWNWKKSGVRENDCLMCHLDLVKLKKFSPFQGAEATGNPVLSFDNYEGSSYDAWLALKMVWLTRKGFFREESSAILHFYNNKPALPEGQSLVKFDLDVKYKDGKFDADNSGLILDVNGKPSMKWNPAAFDANGKVQLSMLRFPSNENCWNCHSVDARRAMSPMGEFAQEEKNADGTIKTDYKDDVHQGKEFTDDNGEKRSIENCNACHSKQYFKPAFKSVDLDADHNFPKGNSDADVRNDLDHDGTIKNCEYCHDKAIHKAIPSGQKSMLEAHRELWKASGNLNGYSADSLTKVTQTHLDTVACQTCHITGLMYDEKTPLLPFYRYRQAENGKSTIVPYNPSVRWYWRDKNSGRILTEAEVQTAFTHDEEHNMSVKDQATGASYKCLDSGCYGWTFEDSYGAFKALKGVYDAILKQKGYANPNVQAVLAENNSYLISHNVRQSNAAQPCAACHARKQNGSFSSLVSATGLLGNDNTRDISLYWDSTAKLRADPRLVTEGIVVGVEPFFKIAANGQITASMGEILSATKENPFMSLVKASKSMVTSGEFKKAKMKDVMVKIKLKQDAARQSLEASMGEQEVFYYDSYQGQYDLKNTSVISFGEGAIAKLLLPKYRVDNQVFEHLPANIIQQLESFAGGKVVSNAFWLGAVSDNKPAKKFPETVYIKIPYKGSAKTPAQVKIISSVDGQQIEMLDQSSVVLVNPQSEASDGYVIFSTDRSQYFALVDGGAIKARVVR